MNNSKTYNAAVYLRLSREDGDVAEGSKAVSNSIANQEELVRDYLKSHPEIRIHSIRKDDGYSGVNFERPAFQEMLNDIRSGEVDCVIVKDLSRFGRNYIESGRYIEKIFPMLGIRFIAVTDGYDSLTESRGDDMIVPFKNLINDAYCRDISIKVRSHMEIKRRNGEYIGAFAAYGYLKDENDKNHLVIDPYAAGVVRDIFTMKTQGMSHKAIAEKLNREGILAPMQYKQSIGIRMECPFAKQDKPKWTYIAVLRILKNEIYIGNLVQGKVTTANYKIKKRVYKDESEWVRIEDAHEAIISKNEFELVQSLLARDMRKSPKKKKVYPLAGLVFCAECGEAMVRKNVPSGKKCFTYYVCAGHKKNKNACSMHQISGDLLEKKVLEYLQMFVKNVLTIAEALDALKKSPNLKPDVVKLEGRLKKLEDEENAILMRKKNIYEDYKDNILSREEYDMLHEQYDTELTEVKSSEQAVKEEIEMILKNETGAKAWIDTIQGFGDIDHLDRSMVVSVIDRIEVVDAEHINITTRFDGEILEMERMIEAYAAKEAV